MEIFLIIFLFPSPAPEGRTDTLQLPYIPQMLAEYIQYKYIYIQLTHVPQSSARRAHRHPPTVIYPPNVGRIYPVQIYVILLYHMFLNLQLQLQLNDFFWIRCQIVRFLLVVPNCPVPNCPGAKLAKIKRNYTNNIYHFLLNIFALMRFLVPELTSVTSFF